MRCLWMWFDFPAGLLLLAWQFLPVSELIRSFSYVFRNSTCVSIMWLKGGVLLPTSLNTAHVTPRCLVFWNFAEVPQSTIQWLMVAKNLYISTHMFFLCNRTFMYSIPTCIKRLFYWVCDQHWHTKFSEREFCKVWYFAEVASYMNIYATVQLFHVQHISLIRIPCTQCYSKHCTYTHLIRSSCSDDQLGVF